jgi:hypothetical protein
MIPKRPIYYWAGIYPSFLVNLRIGDLGAITLCRFRII